MEAKRRWVNVEYAMVQALYWMGYCGAFTFAAPFLQYRGYSNAYLGLVLAWGCILGFLIPQRLAAWIDRSRRVTVFHCLWGLLAGQTLLVLCFFFLPGRSILFSLAYSLYVGLEISINPMNTQMSAELERAWGHINYGAARGMGSLCFAPVAMLLGVLIQGRGVWVLPWVELFFIAAQAGLLLVVSGNQGRAARSVSDGGRQEKAGRSMGAFLAANRRFCILAMGVTLLFFSHSLVGTYAINVVRNVGGDVSNMGSFIGCVALLEVPLMLFYDRLTRRFRCSDTLRFAAWMFGCKGVAVALARSLSGLYGAYLLQLVSFALLTPAMVRYVHLYIDPRDAAKGQALAFGTTTLGNVFTGVLGGLLYDRLGVNITLWVGAAAALAGALLCHLFSERADGRWGD